MHAAVTLHDVVVRYRHRAVLDHISGAFARGSLTAITGPNGAGKSTLLKAITGLVPVASGAVRCDVQRQRIAYLAQQSGIERDFPLSVLDCVTLGYWPAQRPWQRVSPEKIQRAMRALESIGLGNMMRQPVGVLSAGQFQRMLFARVQVQDAELILLDEPFNAIDARTTDDLLNVITTWCAEGRTVVAVMHDHDQIRSWFPTTVLLSEGSLIAWGSTTSVLTRENLFRAGQWFETRAARAA